MLNLTPKPAIYTTSQPDIPKLAKPLTLQQAENLPKVKKALDRWDPASYGPYRIDSLGIRSKSEKHNPAINYLADPTKRGISNFCNEIAIFVLLDLVLFAVELASEKLSHPWAKNVLKTIQANKLVLLGLGVGVTIGQAFLSLGVANKQKETNQKALKAIATYGVNAKFSDA